MAMHHGNYNAIDQLNEEAFGQVSSCDAVGIKSWWKRVCFGLLAMSTLDAYYAYANPWCATNSTIHHFEFI